VSQQTQPELSPETGAATPAAAPGSARGNRDGGSRTLGTLRSALEPLGALVLALVVSGLLVAFSGHSPVDAFRELAKGAVGTNLAFNSTLNSAVPIIFVGLGWILCFSGGRISLGFEGQLAVGGTVAAAIALKGPDVGRPLLLPLVLLGAAVGGALWAGIAAYLLARRGASEVITTLMLNFVALSLLSWVVRGPLQEHTGFFPYSDPIPDAARYPALGSAYPLSWDIVLVVVLAVGLLLLLRRTHFGLRLRLTGSNELAAQAAGIRTMRVALVGFLGSGAVAGLGGASIVLSATAYNLTESFTAGLGFTGIVAALLARNNPIGLLPAAVLLAGLTRGGNSMETQAGVPGSVVLVTQGLVILFVASSAAFGSARLFRRRPRRAAKGASA
jgi:simple sugar transport system permease protein